MTKSCNETYIDKKNEFIGLFFIKSSIMNPVFSCIFTGQNKNGLNDTDRAGDIPVPIPNTEVKPCIADGTARFAAWESRTVSVSLFFLIIKSNV